MVLRAVIGLVFAALLSGCANWAQEGAGTASQTAGGEPLGPPPSYNVRTVNIDVPRTLVVSEANSYFPRGDIVWRGDPPGDRYDQVASIFEEGFARGTADVRGDVPVVVDVEVVRFHSLSEKTRYSFGGVHSIRFEMAIRDASTGELVEPVRRVQADLEGYGGERAIAADAAGQTQKVRITDHLAEVAKVELTDPSGFQNPKLGIIQTYDNTF